MKGNENVIEQLNSALSSELTAIVQYMVQAETLQSQGYERLGGLLKQRAIEEMHHAERLIERIVFFDSQPKVDVALTPQIGGNVQNNWRRTSKTKATPFTPTTPPYKSARKLWMMDRASYSKASCWMKKSMQTSWKHSFRPSRQWVLETIWRSNCTLQNNDLPTRLSRVEI
jgi:rubrerythrin